MKRFVGKTVIVARAAMGIGKEIALGFLALLVRYHARSRGVFGSLEVSAKLRYQSSQIL